MGRKRAACSLLGPILLVGVLAPLFVPTTLAYLEQPFSGTAANSGSIRLLFHLNESSGTSAADASSYANTGTLTNFPANPWSGTALNFDGVDDFVSVASASNLDLTTSLSLEAWVNITDNNPANPLTIVSKWDDTNGRRAYLLRLGTNRKVQFLLSSDGTANPGSLFTAASAAALTINTWYHVSATYDGTTMRILINGVQDGTLAGPASVFVTQAVLRAGARGNAASAAENFFVGAMDEPRVLDYARTDYSALHIYHFNDSGTTPPGDSGGYNHAATLVNAPTYTSTGARFGNGLSFNGTTQYSDSLYIGPDDNAAALSLEAWIQPSVVTGARTILAGETVGSTRMKLRLSGANVQFLLKTGPTTTLTSAGTVSAGVLTHVAATWDGATMKIFINGTQDPNTAAVSGSLALVNRTLRIGASAAPADFFSGTIDEIRVLSTARTSFNAGAVVNEIALSPPSGSQWIEIYNGGGAMLNLAGWVFKNTSDSSTYTVPATGTRTIAPGSFVVIELGSGTDTASTYFTANDPGNSLLSGDLSPSGDSLSVYPNATVTAANIVDYAAWGVAPSNAANGVNGGLWARGTFVGVAPTAQAIGLLADGNDDEGWKDWGGLSPTTKGASNATATAAGVMALHARPVEAGVEVVWATALEPGHVGFNLYRGSSEAGPFEKVNGGLILGRLGSPFGGTYHLLDPQGSQGDWYQLEDLDTAGLPTRHPPVRAGAPDASARALLERLAAPARSAAPRSARADSPATRADSNSSPTHMNLPVSATGLFRLDVDQLVAAFGTKAGRASDFVITDSGIPVPLRIVAPGTTGAGAQLEFFATASEGKYSSEHVYQVLPRSGAGRARPMRERQARVVSRETPVETFPGFTRADENRIYFIGSPEDDLFFRDIVFSERPAITIPFSTDGFAGPARLRGDLVGMTEAPDIPRNHHVRIRLNGIPVYEGYFRGVEAHRFDVALPEGLLAAQNTVELQAVADGGSPVDVFLVNWIEVESHRPLRAKANRLEFSASVSAPVRLTGFTRPDVRVLDVTRPRVPVVLTRVTVRPEPDGTFSVLFQDGAGPSGARRYLAVAGDAILTAALRPPSPESNLRAASNRGEYLVITLPELASALDPLLELRRAEGLETRVVDVEAIYDQFGFGNKSPEAIRNFVTSASTWSAPPKYLLLAGGASFDPRGYLETAWGDLVPTKLFRTRRYHYEAADDGFYTSALPAAAARISVGRLPAQSAAELAAAVEKIVEFETLQSQPQGRALFVSDDRNARNGLSDPTFEQTSDSLAAGLRDTGVDIRGLHLSASVDPRGDLLEAVRGGVDLINFLGHGGVQVWTSQGILTSSDAASLPNGPGSYFTVFSMTCFDGAFTYPYGDSLAWSLVKVPGRGAVAAYSPSTILDPRHHADLDRLLLEGGLRDGAIRLGDLVRRVESSLPNGSGAQDAAESFNLIGDPALRLKWSVR